MNETTGNWCKPPAEITISQGEAHVWRFGLDNGALPLEDFEHLLNEDETRRANRFYFPRDRKSFTVGRATLRKILGLYLKTPPETLQFEYGPQGKPALAARHRVGRGTLEFNLSHSHELALLAVTLNEKIGVDLEFVKDTRDIGGLIRQIFTEQERQEFLQVPAEQQNRAFYTAWTCKEAYLKAYGGGLSIGLDQIEVTFRPDEPIRFLRTNPAVRLAASWSQVELHPGPNYQAALVVAGKLLELSLWDWEF